MLDTDPARLKLRHRSRHDALKNLHRIFPFGDAPCVTTAFDNAIIHTGFCINL